VCVWRVPGCLGPPFPRALTVHHHALHPQVQLEIRMLEQVFGRFGQFKQGKGAGHHIAIHNTKAGKVGGWLVTAALQACGSGNRGGQGEGGLSAGAQQTRGAFSGRAGLHAHVSPHLPPHSPPTSIPPTRMHAGRVC